MPTATPSTPVLDSRINLRSLIDGQAERLYAEFDAAREERMRLDQRDPETGEAFGRESGSRPHPDPMRDRVVQAAAAADFRTRSLALFNWPQAARISSPRGVRTGEA